MMKKFLSLVLILSFSTFIFAQEILANVTVDAQQMAGSNQQVYKTLERNLRDFINNTSWTGKKLQNFEKIKTNFAIIITGKNGNRYNGSLVVQAIRPVYKSTYESPLINLNDSKFTFEYVENQNLVFNERDFSGDNLIDVISYYVYLVLGYDGDSFQKNGGEEWFKKAQKIFQNAQNRGFEGWDISEGTRTRGRLINGILSPNMKTLRNLYYTYHRSGLDNLHNANPAQSKRIIYDALLKLNTYKNNFQQNYAINLFLDTKSDEIFKIYHSKNNGAINMNELKTLMSTFSPKNVDSKWSKWK